MIPKGKELIIPPADRQKMQAFMDKALEGADKTVININIPITKIPFSDKEIENLVSKIDREVQKAQSGREAALEVEKASKRKSKMIPLSCHDCEEVIGFCGIKVSTYIQCAWCLNEDYAVKN